MNLAVGWWGLALVDVPMFLAIRRTTTIIVMIIEFFVIGTAPSVSVRLAVGVMMMGTVIAAVETFNDDFRGYMFVLMNNTITAVQLNFAKKFRNDHDVQGFGLVFYNGLVALPLSLIMAFLMGEFEYASSYPHLHEPGFIAAVVIASSAGALMTYVVLLCATVNSPTITSITGNVKDVVTTFIGAALFDGFVPTPLKITGLAVSFGGGGWFSYLKLIEKSKPAAPELKDGATATSDGAGSAERETEDETASLARSAQGVELRDD
jgi:solute carrier family 35 protein